MKRVIIVLCLCLSCVYGGGGGEMRMILAKKNIKNLRALGIGYCLGYNVEKLYNELKMWLDVDESADNAIINEIKSAVDIEKKKLITPKRKYDETALLFNDCFFIDSIGYRKEIQRIAEKYCVRDCSAIKQLKNWCN